MLTHSDVIAAKAIGQLGWVAPGVLVESLQRLEREDDGDLIHRLQARGFLSAAKAGKARSFVGRFHIVCHESVVLRLLEARGFQNLPTLMARVEITGHQQRLATAARAEGLVSEEEAWELEQRAQQEVFRNGVTLLERYRREQFAGVARPLIPGGALLEESFRVSRLFRDPEFHVKVLQEIARERDRALSQSGPRASVRLVEDEDDTTPLVEAPVAISGRRSALPDLKSVGPYRISRCLGRGGMGAVYLAMNEHDPLLAEVAVKVLAPDAGRDDRERFRREVEVSARLNHPALVRLIDSGELEDGTLYMVLPAYRSTSVQALLRENLVTPSLAFAILEQLLEALGAVHAVGIVHRDVKPGNILLTQEARALRLIDFGISRYIDEAEGGSTFRTGVGNFVGSVHYTAPENLSSDAIDERADLYSVGIVAFELLTGQSPFARMPRAQVLIAQLRQTPPLLSEVRPDITWLPELELLIRKLLAKVPAERPRTTAEVLEALRGGLAAESIRLMKGGSVGPISGSFMAMKEVEYPEPDSGGASARGR